MRRAAATRQSIYSNFAKLYEPESHTNAIATNSMKDLVGLLRGPGPKSAIKSAKRRREDFQHSIAVQILHDGSRTELQSQTDGDEHRLARTKNVALQEKARAVEDAASAYLQDASTANARALATALRVELNETSDVSEIDEWANISESEYPMNQGLVYPQGIKYVREFATANAAAISNARGRIQTQLRCFEGLASTPSPSRTATGEPTPTAEPTHTPPSTEADATESPPDTPTPAGNVAFFDGFEDKRYDGWELVWFEDMGGDDSGLYGYGEGILNYWDVEARNAISGQYSLHLIARSYPAARATVDPVLTLDSDFDFSYRYYFEDSAIGGPRIHLWDRDESGSVSDDRLEPGTWGAHVGSAIRPYDGGAPTFEMFGQRTSVPSNEFAPNESHRVRVVRENGQITGYHDGSEMVSTSVDSVSADLSTPHKLIIVSGTSNVGTETPMWLDDFRLQKL